MHQRLFLVMAALLFSFALQAQTRDPIVGFGKYYAKNVNGKWQIQVVSTADLLSNPEVTVMPSDYRVASFDFSIKPTQNDYIGPISVKGSKCGDQVTKILRTYSGEGGVVYIENIKVVGPDKRPRTVIPIILKYQN